MLPVPDHIKSFTNGWLRALAILGLLLQLIAPGLLAPAPDLAAAAPPGLKALFTEICRHSGSADAPFEEPQAPDHRKSDCCQGCCCLVSLAGLLPAPITLADPERGGGRTAGRVEECRRRRIVGLPGPPTRTSGGLSGTPSDRQAWRMPRTRNAWRSCVRLCTKP